MSAGIGFHIAKITVNQEKTAVKLVIPVIFWAVIMGISLSI